MPAAREIVESYLTARGTDLDWQRVEDNFWFVRIAGKARTWIPIEITIGQRTLKALSYFAIEPEELPAEAYRFLLQHNFRGSGIAFSSDKDRAIALVGRIELESLTTDRLDELIGKIVDTTESTFQGFLRIGFASRFAERVPPVEGCLACEINAGRVEPPGGLVHSHAGWRIEHITSPAPIRGWMIVKPVRHVESIDALTPAEADALSPILHRVAAAVRAETGAEKIYVAAFGEAVSHLHFHVIPRLAALEERLRGPGVFGLLAQVADGTFAGVPDAEAAAVAARIRVRLFEPR